MNNLTQIIIDGTIDRVLLEHVARKANRLNQAFEALRRSNLAHESSFAIDKIVFEKRHDYQTIAKEFIVDSLPLPAWAAFYGVAIICDMSEELSLQA